MQQQQVAQARGVVWQRARRREGALGLESLSFVAVLDVASSIFYAAPKGGCWPDLTALSLQNFTWCYTLLQPNP